MSDSEVMRAFCMGGIAAMLFPGLGRLFCAKFLEVDGVKTQVNVRAFWEERSFREPGMRFVVRKIILLWMMTSLLRLILAIFGCSFVLHAPGLQKADL